MFVSGIITPIKAMPSWEQKLAMIMPLYYACDLTKGAMLGIPCQVVRDVLVLLSFAFISLLISRTVLARSQASV
jgi:ABC-type uncharacterized transport system permease subunit